jgi:predicted amidohydrolase YtcJ
VSPTVLALLSPLPSTISGGSIPLDPITNNPLGILIDNAMKLVDDVRPARTEAELGRWLRKCARGAVEKGLVGVGDAGTSFAELAFFEK